MRWGRLGFVSPAQDLHPKGIGDTGGVLREARSWSDLYLTEIWEANGEQPGVAHGGGTLHFAFHQSCLPRGIFNLESLPRPRWGSGRKGPTLGKSHASALGAAPTTAKQGALPPSSPPPPSPAPALPESMPFPVTTTIKKAKTWRPAFPSRCSFLTRLGTRILRQWALLIKTI